MSINILVFAGSARNGSLNRKLADIAENKLREQGILVSGFDFRENPLPLYDADLEANEGLPETVKALKQAVSKADAILIASPEYNTAITPLLKNAIDWVSRASTEGSKNEWSGKLIGLMAAAPGPFGGIRALPGVSAIFMSVGATVIPTQVAVGNGSEVITESGINNERAARMFEKLLSDLVTTAQSRHSMGV